jgi:excisionase family DNA binding protein
VISERKRWKFERDAERVARRNEVPPSPAAVNDESAADELPTSVREVLNVVDAAAFLGLNRNTVRDFANNGTIPHRRVGKRLLFSRTALVRWLGATR